MAKPTNAEIEAKRAVIAEAREQALQAKAETIRVKAHNKAENIRRKADAKAKRAIAKGEAHAAKIEGIVPAEIERKRAAFEQGEGRDVVVVRDAAGVALAQPRDDAAQVGAGLAKSDSTCMAGQSRSCVAGSTPSPLPWLLPRASC